MDRKEREIIDRIKDRADEIKAADSLSPDHVKAVSYTHLTLPTIA